MEEVNKAHRPSKRREKKKAPRGSTREQNPKAFAPASGYSLERKARRKADLDEKRLHVPLPDRSGDDSPPIVVVVAGPPKCGKSTLIKSLVKRYTKHTLGDVRGPVTVVGSNKKRYTFVECSSDLNQMIDLAKVADLVLLVTNAKSGFEMETFEFLNILQTHGFPKVVGILTHLDLLRNNKALKTKKRSLKKRFWTEVYDGAKLFYLTKFSNGKYFKDEIVIITRYMSVLKFRPLIWRNTHAYALIDRVEDATDPELVRMDGKCDRVVYLYGYARGANLRMNSVAHIPGVCDSTIENIKILGDPCPLPDKGRKTLSDKNRVLYAPHSSVSGIRYDSDAIYVSVPGRFGPNNQNKHMADSEGAQMLASLSSVREGAYEKMKDYTMKIFPDSRHLKASEMEGIDYEGSISSEESSAREDQHEFLSDSLSAATEDQDMQDETSALESMDPLRAGTLTKKIYESNTAAGFSPARQHNPDDIFIPKSDGDPPRELDSSKIELIGTARRVGNEGESESLRNRFITGDVDTSVDDVEGGPDGENNNAKEERLAEKIRLKRSFDMMDTRWGEDVSKDIYSVAKLEELKRKQRTKEMFENEDLEAATAVLGIHPGKYIRFTMKLPYEFIKYYNPDSAVVIGVVGNNEQSTRFIHARLKRHRWYKKVLKTNDPLIFSIGWRRFQSLPVYYINDTVRNRYLKYTPEHMHCCAAFYGYSVPPNFGFCAFQSVKRDVSNFRISATGVILDIDASVNIVKKLKLVGVPSEIHKNTAFIKDMFNSALEVAKFEGASIRTVSGIRGQIKKHVGSPEGRFRATFEDKILMSDIVFLKAWCRVEPIALVNPVNDKLFGKDSEWKGVRTTAEIRHSMNIMTPSNPDSAYRAVVRTVRRFDKLRIPENLQKKLPFASKPKLIKKRVKPGLRKSTAVLIEKPEKKIRSIVQQIATIAKHKEEKRRAKAKAALAKKT